MCSGTDHASGNTNKRKILLEFLECYWSLPILWDTNHAAYNNRQKKCDAYNELLNKFKQVEPNTTRDTMVWKINSMLLAFLRVEKLRDSKRSWASADYVYKQLLWYFNELLFLLDQDTPVQSRSTVHEGNEAMTEECTVYLLHVWSTETHCSFQLICAFI
jgi:hypothetical protein